ncbi:hypothetical protein [Pararhodospirillum oryzae]|uniref:PH domain-containing protein n=1 Tax=Pararhodospirillum oryzae TaxID=478448 RepID=A0A512H8Q7_9PROT|nr:hypothetical protein [Pararhodospirillum oryzae]GEO81832.1 hypothetical protein ROR02_19630 [Pararhodospirillum oryzae]
MPVRSARPLRRPIGTFHPLEIRGRRAAVWGHAVAAAGLGVLALTLPVVGGGAGAAWMMALLVPAVWMGLQAWGHAVLRIEVGRAGLRFRVPGEVMGVFVPPVQDIRFPWMDVESVHLMEGLRSQDPGILGRALEPLGGVLLIRAGDRSVRLTGAMLGAQMLDVAELVAVGADKPVHGGSETFHPGDW